MPIKHTPAADYLGDSVYADRDDFGALILTTENGIEASNTIILEPEVIRALLHYLARQEMMTKR